MMVLLALVLVMFGYFNSSAKPEPPRAQPKEFAEEKAPTPSYETFTVVDRSRLNSFVDYARKPDNDSYYYLLDLAANNPPDRIREAAQEAAYEQLKDNPDFYRGKIFRFDGRLRRMRKDEAAKNEFGFVHQYEGYVYPNGWHGEVLLVASADIGGEVPTGGDLYEPVEGVGYFLGWWRYRDARQQLVDTPILILSSIRSTKAPDEPLTIPTLFLWIVGGGLAVVIPAAVWWFYGRVPKPDPAILSTDESLVWQEPILTDEQTDEAGSQSTHQANGDSLKTYPSSSSVIE